MENKNKSPKDFELRVRKHPGTLKITRPSIMKNTKEVKWSYQDQLEQTTKINIEKSKIEKVWHNFHEFSKVHKESFNEHSQGFLALQTSIDVIIGLLSSENNFQDDTRVQIIKFLELCKAKNLLSNWTVAIKLSGDSNEMVGKGILKSSESNLPKDVKLSIRRGPKNEGSAIMYRDSFLKKKIFSASGKSANIVSSGRDFSLLLSPEQIIEAENQFIIEQTNKIMRRDKNMTEEQAKQRANNIQIPERVYREKMNNEGLLVIYLMDSYYVFLQERGVEDIEMKQMVIDGGYNLDIPVIGYAIGFPPIEPDPGGVYVKGDYDLSSDEDFDVEFGENSELPLDAIEENIK
jgi:hypothetical protein